jgi:hypothetical protein
MALPIAPILFMVGRSVATALRKWPGILAFTGLIIATGFTFMAMINQMGETALRLWPILVIACFFLLLKEVVKAWVKIKQNERISREKNES